MPDIYINQYKHRNSLHQFAIGHRTHRHESKVDKADCLFITARAKSALLWRYSDYLFITVRVKHALI